LHLGTASGGSAEGEVPLLGSWGVTYPASVQGLMGSCVVVPCTFSYPDSVSASAGIVAIWYRDYNGDKTVVYHSASPGEVDGRFGDRSRLLGDLAAHNCTLLLTDVTPQDSGSYRFRFEIIGGDRWSAAQDVLLSVAGERCRVRASVHPPRIAASEEVSEGAATTLDCSAPYACPLGGAGLRWRGYDARLATVATGMRLDTGGVLLRQSLTTAFSWADHSRKLLCELSLGSRTATRELVLHVRHAPRGITASVQPSARNIRVGDAVSLACAVNSSYPPVSAYRWYKDGAAVGAERLLTLQHVRREDYGRYHCEAENAVGAAAAPALTLFVFCESRG
uniref:Ig-like domain-containing protein n=1 Tax=Nothoprocta perdicaria TaxID=30464 RepID=A0A8C6ZF21_NOTPE